jgi:hypothetical protein
MALQPVEMTLGSNTWGGILDTSTDWMLGPTFDSVDVAAAFLHYHKGGRSLRLMNDNDLDQQRYLFTNPVRCENEPCEHDTKDGYTGMVRMYRATLGEYEKEVVIALCGDCVASLNARYKTSIAKEESDAAAGFFDGDYSDSYISVDEIDGIEYKK